MAVVRKANLTPEEKIKAAYLHYVRGYDQHIIASDFFDGINHGRINEACKAIMHAARNGIGKNNGDEQQGQAG